MIALIGFQEKGEFLVLPPTNKVHISSIQASILEVITEHGEKLGTSINTGFNPYAEQFTDMSYKGKLKVHDEKEKYDHLSIEELIW